MVERAAIVVIAAELGPEMSGVDPFTASQIRMINFHVRRVPALQTLLRQKR
jgi:hypothetical protein